MKETIRNEMATLSKLLQRTMLNTKAWEVAVTEGYIVLDEDGQHLKWTLGSKTLLAYFCGKMWCGDTGVFSRNKQAVVWHTGKKAFPARELGQVFCISSLKQKRRRRSNMALPVNYQLVDALFF